MVDCAHKDTPPPAPLILAWHCERWHALPDAGGVNKQDYQTMTEMTACANIYRAVMAYKRDTSGKAWSDNERKIIGMLVENGMLI